MLTTQMTMAEALQQVAAARPDQEALVCGDVRLTYRELVARAEALAHGLWRLGIRKGDRVAALLPPGPEFVFLFFALARMGGVMVPLNPQLRRQTLSVILRDAEPIMLASAFPLDDDVLAQIPGLQHLVAVPPAQGFGTPWQALFTPFDQDGVGTSAQAGASPDVQLTTGHRTSAQAGASPDVQLATGRRTLVRSEASPDVQSPDGRRTLVQAGASPDVQFATGRRTSAQAGASPDVQSPDGRRTSVQDTSPLPEVSPTDLLALLYTSGTTGTPKGSMHTHRSLIAPVVASIKLRELWLGRPNLEMLGRMFKALVRYRERLLRAAGQPQTMLSTTGWQNTTGLEVMLQALLMGDRLVVMPRFHPREALRLIEQERVTILVAVPTAYQVMLALPDFDRFDLSSLLICGTGAAPCPPQLAREIQRRFGCAVHIGFGATETGGGISATSLDDSERAQAETVGRPMPGMEIKIVDDQRREVPRGRVGELACRSDSIMLGYYRAPEATAEVLDEEGWYYTGDLAWQDEEGYLHIVGRKRDVIIRGGQNIYPAEIEAFLAAHPKIQEAAVVGVPSGVAGENVWAFVIPRPDTSLTPQEVLDYCRSALEPYKIPAVVRIVPDFPRAEGGKPQKFALKALALREMEGGESS